MKEINSLLRISNYRPFLLKFKACPSFRGKCRPSMTDLGLLTLIFKIYIKFPKFWCIETLFTNLPITFDLSHSLFICFRLDIPFSCKFGPKSQNCWFKLKFWNSNFNMQNSMFIFIFFCLRQEITFFGIFGPKNQKCQSELKFGT